MMPDELALFILKIHLSGFLQIYWQSETLLTKHVKEWMDFVKSVWTLIALSMKLINCSNSWNLVLGMISAITLKHESWCQ